MHLMVAIENYGDNFFLSKAQKDLEIIFVTPNQLRVNDLRLVDILMVVVVLDHRKYLLDRRGRNEGGSDPVVDEAARHLDRTSARPEFRHDLPLTDVLSSFRRLARPEEGRASVQSLLHLRFRLANVSIKCLQRSRLQLHTLYSLHHSSGSRGMLMGETPSTRKGYEHLQINVSL